MSITPPPDLAPVFLPESFGAKGDGVTDDTLAIRATISAVAAGGTIQLKGGSTYLVSGSLNLLQGQTVWGYGAAVLRCAAVTTTTTGAISTGSSPTTIPVSSSAGFAVGMDVAVWQSSSVYDTSTHRILAIPDSTHITVGTNFTQALASGSTVTTAFPIFITSSNSDVRVMGVEINGNRANNTGIAKWWWHSAAYLLGDRAVVRDCYIHDEVSEGIIFGGSGSLAENNSVLNLGGNGIHFSGSKGAKAIGNFVQNANLAGPATDHANGCIIFSNNTGDSIVSGNYCENGICGIGSIDSDDNSSVTITGNIVKACTSFAIDGNCGSGTSAGRVTITGNLFYDSQQLQISNQGSFSPSAGCYNWIVSNNYFKNTGVFVGKSFGISITGNQFDFSGNTTSTIIYPDESQNILIADNQLRGGETGVFVDGADTSGLKIKSNLFQNNYNRGCYVSQHSGRAVSVEGNTVVVESGFTCASGWIGIYAHAASTFVTGNTFDANGTFSGSSYGLYGSPGGEEQNGAIMTNNFVRSTGLSAAIFFPPSSQGNVAAYNFTQQAVTDSGTNTLVGNVTIY